MRALHQNNTWVRIPHSDKMNVVNCKWVFLTKLEANGSLDHLKASLVAKGFHQEEGFDFIEIFNLVVKASTIRIVLAIA